jgi:hypothetical protein
MPIEYLQIVSVPVDTVTSDGELRARGSWQGRRDMRDPPTKWQGGPRPAGVLPGAARWVDGHGVRWMVTVGVLPGTTVA